MPVFPLQNNYGKRVVLYGLQSNYSYKLVLFNELVKRFTNCLRSALGVRIRVSKSENLSEPLAVSLTERKVLFIYVRYLFTE